ncbi:MAG: outer membrane beta-barrel protein [Spirochaetales bacterium]|nr:outer membrane beta-barrel protein [Spirochaetales bacterium]
MKKILILLILLLVGSMLFGQDNKAIKSGNIMIGGSLSGGVEMGSYSTIFDGEEVTGSKVNILNIGLMAEIGYFIIDQLEVGAVLRFTNDKLSNPDNSDEYLSQTQIGIGVQAGYYFDLGGMLAMYGKVSAMYLTQTDDYSGTESSSSGFQVIPEVGAALFLNNNAAIQIAGFLNYNSISDDEVDDVSVNTITYGIKIGAAIFM